MTAVTDQTQFLGFADVDVGVAGQQMLKSSISPFNVLDNVLKSFKAQDGTTKEQVLVAIVYCPSVTLAAGGAAMEGAGYANLAKGSFAICANGFGFKDGAAGTDSWTSIIAS